MKSINASAEKAHQGRRKFWKDDAVLARLGYKSQFRREFSLFETVAFAFSIMGVSAAVSTAFYFPLASGGHVGMVFGWLIPCFFILCIASCLAELTSSMPTSAGLYYFSAKLAPEKYSALACWMTGWSNVTGQVALVCSIDFTCAEMIATAVAVGTDGRVILSPGATFALMVGIIITHGICCSASTKDSDDEDHSLERPKESTTSSAKRVNMFDSIPAVAVAPSTSSSNEARMYLESPIEQNVTDALKWWYEKRDVYPKLHRMALDYLSIPATSVGVERTFSTGRLILSHIRNRLTAKTTRALMCVGAWSKLGFVEDSDVVSVAKLADAADDDVEILDRDWARVGAGS